jgi:hypothetical protein
MNKILLTLIAIVSLSTLSFAQTKSLKGTWQFNGGIYNGKPDGAPKDYKLQRIYTDKGFTAYASQKGYKTERYEAGNYVLKGDSCFETSTFSSRPSQLLGKRVPYLLKISKTEIIFSGQLPSGMVVEEHWIKIK